MNAPIRPQEDLFPWEEPDEPRAPERVSAAPAAPSVEAPSRTDATEPEDEMAGEEEADAFDFGAASALLDRLEREAGLAPVVTRDRPSVAPREYYAISEVCDLVGLKPHVLRYWETQFPPLNPSKNRSGNRVYRRKEIKLILLVKHLLYGEKYTIEGAKAKLERMRRGGELNERMASAVTMETLGLLRTELDALYRLLTPRESV